MKQNVVVESVDRELAGVIIKQRTKDDYFSLKDVLLVCNKSYIEQGRGAFNLNNFLSANNTKLFISELEKREQKRVYYPRAKGKEGWIHPYLCIKMLIYSNPKFEIKVYDWLLDLLMKYRRDSGDSYTRMSGVLFKYSSDRVHFHSNIQKLARLIKDELGVSEWNKASESQLRARDYIHNLIADLAQGFADSNKGANMALQIYKKAKDLKN